MFSLNKEMESIFIVYIFLALFIIIVALLHMKKQNNKDTYMKKFLNKEKLPLKYIPKKIFQLIPDKHNIHKDFQTNIDFIKTTNPDWNYTLYDDTDIIQYIKNNYNMNILNYYNKINPKYGAARADFFRYLLLYKEGGAYFDIKSAPTIPLSTIILPDDECILTNWDVPHQRYILNNFLGEFQQWYIICRPGHPFLYYTLLEVMKNIDNYNIDETGTGKLATLKVTGPIAYTKAILSVIDKYNNYRVVDYPDNIGLSYNNIKQSHINLYSKTHYSKINEPVILK